MANEVLSVNHTADMLHSIQITCTKWLEKQYMRSNRNPFVRVNPLSTTVSEESC